MLINIFKNICTIVYDLLEQNNSSPPLKAGSICVLQFRMSIHTPALYAHNHVWFLPHCRPRALPDTCKLGLYMYKNQRANAPLTVTERVCWLTWLADGLTKHFYFEFTDHIMIKTHNAAVCMALVYTESVLLFFFFQCSFACLLFYEVWHPTWWELSLGSWSL